MTDKNGVPSLWLEFDERGTIDAGAATELTAVLDRPGIEELIVMAHGWKNDKNDATKLYGALWSHACTNFPTGTAERIVVARVLWPAKAFRTDFDEAALAAAHSSNTLAGPGGAVVKDLTEDELEALLTEFSSFMGASGA